MGKRKNYLKIKGMRGSTTIVVLIMAFVIITAMTTLAGYMFRDVIFTQFDEGKFRALNIAEAGLADMYSNIEDFYDEEISYLPPSSGYSEDVEDSGGVVQGSFFVTYEEVYNGDNELTNYIITSEGTDLRSGETREIKVNLGVSFSTEVNIFDYIYSGGSITFDDLTLWESNPFFNGPLYVRGDVSLRLLEGRYFSGGGKILIGGNLDMGEWSEIDIAGPIHVGGSVEMSGRAYIGHNFEDYMIVMGDIRMKDNSQIGQSSGNPINLCCEGTIDVEGGADLYYTPPLGDEIFDPPNFDPSVYINNFIIQIEGPPLDVLEIDESDDGTADGDFIIDPILLPPTPPYEFSRSSDDNSFRFWYDEIDGHYYLEVLGNVMVDGNIIIGEMIEDSSLDDPDNDIYYSGIGKLIATGDIEPSCGLVPTDTDDFPDDSLLILMAEGSIIIDIGDYNNFYGDHDDPDLYMLGIAGGNTTLSRHTAVLGSVIASQIDADDLGGILGWLIGSHSSIGYQDGLVDSIPEDMPMLYYGGATFTKEWQEVVE